MNFSEYKCLDLAEINRIVLDYWNENKTFENSLKQRIEGEKFVFLEGPPSANGMPGIHHVMARTIKDLFCRYKTQQGFLVERKAGWDTHGLPVELGVEKSMGVTKEDIGKKISVEEYNSACRKEVMKYTKEWEQLTEQMGYWVDMQDPYITYDNRYIETLWYLLKEIYKKGYLYKGYSIQPYSPAAGTGLSTHELNQPGCYRDVKDTTCVAQFEVLKDENSAFLFKEVCEVSGKELPLYFLAWTTTPWTLPSNTALCVGSDIEYVKIRSFNQYSGEESVYILAKDLVSAHFDSKGAEASFEDYKAGDKVIPWSVMGISLKGKELCGLRYAQLLQWIKPEENSLKVISGDFVTTSDGTGIVHIAPTFGADDNKVAKLNGIAPLLVKDSFGVWQPLVDRAGRMYRMEDLDEEFRATRVMDAYSDFAGRFVKNEYNTVELGNDKAAQPSLDVDIVVSLKQRGAAFKIEKYTHSYPHCWRTDKPVLYYPLDSWFIKTTAVQKRMIELNSTINWKPETTGSGRFGKWLENLQDWNLSRSRYWGTPLPVWRTEDGAEERCIGSLEELYVELDRSVQYGFMPTNPLKDKGFIVGDFSKENYEKIDLHRPWVDSYVLVSERGEKMYRETDLIDVWFDSGSMPFAQFGLEKLNCPEFGRPGDFIAEGVDQTRGWFFTLHAIAVMIKDDVAFKTVISNGLVLDKDGNKMSKRLGNAVDPFKILNEYGADPLRWYMISNSQPWDNLKFDEGGVDEVRRKFFGTLYNTYSFFALYANVDGFDNKAEKIPVCEMQEIDRWIISLLNTLIKEVTEAYDDYDATKAARKIEDFVNNNLSNWYVRLNRKRFWGGKMDRDKLAAYQTLYSCLETVAILSAPVAPFFMERLFLDLNRVSGIRPEDSVHLVNMPQWDELLIDTALEERMELAQRASSMILALRRKVNIKVRQPLSKILVPVLSPAMKTQFEMVRDIVLSEVNVKQVEFIDDTKGIIIKSIKPNFKTLGKRYGKQMKEISAAFTALSQDDIYAIEASESYTLSLPSGDVNLSPQDVEISSEDMPGWLVAVDGRLTIALDITIDEKLKREGVARELVNRIQNIRKESGFDVTDRISVEIEPLEEIVLAMQDFKDYVASQVLAKEISITDTIDSPMEIEWNDSLLRIKIKR